MELSSIRKAVNQWFDSYFGCCSYRETSPILFCFMYMAEKNTRIHLVYCRECRKHRKGKKRSETNVLWWFVALWEERHTKKNINCDVRANQAGVDGTRWLTGLVVRKNSSQHPKKLTLTRSWLNSNYSLKGVAWLLPVTRLTAPEPGETRLNTLSNYSPSKRFHKSLRCFKCFPGCPKAWKRAWDCAGPTGSRPPVRKLMFF